eukprot:TRINITY_DN8188_c0_g1_i1.p1 TRINITY_DN8188_c0_g1~~TRINITY_DN8188_c0_g1_i1.p1  ORF type:complete len:256 (-),score=50.71 TRINITY_DN8188_c0_g1_i1:355-1122(-)
MGGVSVYHRMCMLVLADLFVLAVGGAVCWALASPHGCFTPTETLPPRDPLATTRSLAPGAPLVARTLNALLLFIPFVCAETVVLSLISPLCTASATRIIVRALSSLCTGTLFWHVSFVLFGAEVFEGPEKTFMLAALVAALVTVPGVAVLGWERSAWHMQLFSSPPVHAYTPLQEFGNVDRHSLVHFTYVVPGIAVVLGVWVGAFPLPLDWDRVWQEWPITGVAGALLGRAVGSLWGLACLTFHAQGAAFYSKEW